MSLYLAFTIVFAHSIVPHHHDEMEATEHHHNEAEATEHHHDSGADHHEDEDSPLAHDFEHFHHSGSTIQFIPSHFSILKSLNSFELPVFIQPVSFLVKACESPPVVQGFTWQHAFYSFLFYLQTSLRAPPFFIG